VNKLGDGQVIDVLRCAYLQAGKAMSAWFRDISSFEGHYCRALRTLFAPIFRIRNSPGHIESNNVPNQSHTKAAEHHETAAKSHRAAAEQHGKNEHGKAKEHATQAQQHSKTARDHSEQANTKAAAQK
jgi:hypothetical protein